MFHWTAALKEEKLLFNFFKRLRFNTTDRYPEFRYLYVRKTCHYKYSRFLSLCGKERNFIRCEDRPIVFHNSKILPTPSGVTIRSCQLHMSKSPNVSYIYLNCNSEESVGTSCTIMLGTNWQLFSSHTWLPWCPAQVYITKPFILRH